jgi:AraC-like DNA-binding protein
LIKRCGPVASCWQPGQTAFLLTWTIHGDGAVSGAVIWKFMRERESPTVHEHQLVHANSHEIFFRKRLGGDFSTMEVTARQWTLLRFNVQQGFLQITSNGRFFTTSEDAYGAFIPPFSIYHVRVKSSLTDIEMYWSTRSLPSRVLPAPLLFRWKAHLFDGSFESAIRVLREADDLLNCEQMEAPTPMALQYKSYIDSSFEDEENLAAIASQMGYHRSQLARAFKRQYGLTAVDYRSRLRSNWAAHQLIRRKERSLLDVAFDVGFRDLSQFYKQFRRHTRMAPGAIRRIIASRSAPG